MRIRHACRREIEAAAEDQNRPWMVAVCHSLLESFDLPGRRVLIAEDMGHIQAVLGLEMRWVDGGAFRNARISHLAVDPEYSGSGLGPRLVRFAEGIARVHGVTRVDVAQGLEAWGGGRCWPSLGYVDPGAGLSKGLRSLQQRTCG